jgi:glycerol-3-phosphate O-acyltransferase
VAVAAAEPDVIWATIRDAPVKLAHRVLGPFLESYEVLTDRLAARDPGAEIDEGAFVKECVGIGRQLVLQRRLDSPESVSRELFKGALELASNRGLLEPGGQDVRARREDLAREVRDAVRRVRVVRALARGEQQEQPWATSAS